MSQPVEELRDAIEGYDSETERIEALLEAVDPNVQLGEEDDQAYLIHVAAVKGTKETVRALLDEGADPGVRDEYGKTPLHEAAQKGADSARSTDPEIVELLLDEGLNPNAKQMEGTLLGGREGDTPLHRAAEQTGDSAQEVVGSLLQHGADPSIQNEDGETPLHLVSERNVAESFLNHGADPNAEDENGETPLHVAAEDGNDEIARVLLEAGADPSAKDDLGARPIHKAAGGGWPDTVEMLLDEGVAVDARDEEGKTPLHKAASAGEAGEAASAVVDEILSIDEDESSPENDPEETLRTLIEAGADTGAKGKDKFPGKGNTPLHCAASRDRLKNMEVLFEAGAEVGVQNAEGQTPLHLAAKNGNMEVVNELIGTGADVNVRSSAGETALHLAAEFGDTEVVDRLIQAGAELDVQQTEEVGFTSQGDTPILRAVADGNTEAVRTLSDAGADLELANARGYTALVQAVESTDVETASLLLEQGADPDTRSGGGHFVGDKSLHEPRPLHIAAAGGMAEITELLLDYGADPAAVHEEDGKTPAELVEEKGEPKVAELLRSQDSN